MSRGGPNARESWLSAVLGDTSTGEAMPGVWPGPSERKMCGVLGVGRIDRSVLATNPTAAQAITTGSQMRSGTLRLNSEATRLM